MSDGKSSILTNTQRDWLNGNDEPAKRDKTRSRIHERIREALTTDAGLIGDELVDGELNPDTIVNDIDDGELADGISAMVAALYRIGDESGIRPETTIKRGIKRGREGRIAVLENKLEQEGPKALTIGEAVELRDENPQLAGKLNRALDQQFSDSDGGMLEPEEDIFDVFDVEEG